MKSRHYGIDPVDPIAEGRTAANNRIHPSKNPYERGTSQYQLWIDSYIEARRFIDGYDCKAQGYY